MRTTRSVHVAMACVLLLTMGSAVQAQSLSHIDQLAISIQRQAGRIACQTRDISYIVPHAGGLSRDAHRLRQLARHIHELAHVGHASVLRCQRVRVKNELAHINRDVAQLDQLMHGMQDTVADLKSRIQAKCLRSSTLRPKGIGLSFGRHSSVRFEDDYLHRRRQGHEFELQMRALVRVEHSLKRLEQSVHHLLEETKVTCYRNR